jgi:hypothetical protein
MLEAESHEGLARQMEKINVSKALIKHRKLLAACYRVVAKDLSSLERM